MQHKKHKNKGHTKHAEAISSKHKITKQRHIQLSVLFLVLFPSFNAA
jgi:hypothetical protein